VGTPGTSSVVRGVVLHAEEYFRIPGCVRDHAASCPGGRALPGGVVVHGDTGDDVGTKRVESAVELQRDVSMHRGSGRLRDDGSCTGRGNLEREHDGRWVGHHRYQCACPGPRRVRCVLLLGSVLAVAACSRCVHMHAFPYDWESASASSE